jgi:hypothetical protein
MTKSRFVTCKIRTFQRTQLYSYDRGVHTRRIPKHIFTLSSSTTLAGADARASRLRHPEANVLRQL